MSGGAIRVAETVYAPVKVGTGSPGLPGRDATPEDILAAIAEYIAANPLEVDDATDSVKGILRLAGDLAGTADAPTVPELAAKAPLESPAFTGTPTGITKAHVGLGDADNTSDVDKPVSTAQAAALDAKSDEGHTHPQSDVTGLTTALEALSPGGHTHTSAGVTDFTEAVQDAVAALLAQGTNVTLVYDDSGNSLSISAAGGSSFDAEAARDALGVALVGVGNITVTVNDALDTITLSTTATVNATDAALRDRSTHTGTQDADTITDGTTNKAFQATERTKLSGIAPSATANDTDANLKARANHTGTQLAATISDFSTAADARVAAGITGKLDTSAAPELIRDTIGTALVAGAGATVTPDDGGDTITVGLNGEAAVNTVAATGATETLSAAYQMHKVTMDQSCTFTFTSPAAGAVFAVLLSGAFTPTWPASVKWSGGSLPAYTTPALYVFATFDGGTTWEGVQSGKAFA